MQYPRRTLAALVLAVLLAGGQRADAAADSDYVAGLIERARELGLAHETQWLRLGHWRRGTLGGFSSQADGDAFFLSDTGRRSPDAELAATLRAFFAPAAPDGEHAFCRFPARFRWLDSKLGFDRSRVQQRACSKRDRFVESIDGASITIVFSSYYLSNAASAFGHTLLRINRRTAEGSERRALLDTGINYSAEVDTGNALLYAFKGMFGMFRGNFLRMPYYYKVREYNDYESRDLWEYELALSDDEVERLVEHVWELGSTHFDYYYLSENCSYHLLAAIEAAAPRLDLVDGIKWPTVPADTVKALFEHRGLVRAVAFRPSLRSQFRARFRDLDAAQRDLLHRLQDDPRAAAPAGMSTADEASALDAALDALDMLNGEEILLEPDSEVANLRLALMGRRAALGVTSDELELHTDLDDSPHRGHGSRRVGIASGLRDADPYAAFHARLALHDLANPSRGYPSLSQLEFLPTELRYWYGDHRVTLERLDLVSVVNLVPLTGLDKQFSWRLDVGSRRLRDEGCGDCFAGRFHFGAGGTLATSGAGAAFFVLADAELGAHPELPVFGMLQLALGGVGGLRLELDRDLVAVATVRAAWLVDSEPARVLEGRGVLRWQYGRNQAISAAVDARASSVDGQLGWMLYY